jgi:transcriptional regulator with GAF, ATPase, and Fis domain
MRQVTETIDRVAPTDATVLVWGETGVGKELVARAVHRQSPRRPHPFVKVNCAALPLELLESELFGHERGAFTGAHRQKPGKFELANGGTIFLDEIGEMPLPLQAKLLHVLQDQEFGRLGSERDIRVDVRVLAATNKKLSVQVEQGMFRSDLYYRLNVVAIHVPPLRDRREEIPALVDQFLTHYAEQYRQPRPTLPSETLRRFIEYRWPGNVRELENWVKRIVVIGPGDWINQEMGSPPPPGENGHPVARPTASASTPGPPLTTRGDASAMETALLGNGASLKEIVRQAALRTEAAALRAVLDRVHWHRLEAARQLKVGYKTLLQKIKLHGLES